MSFPVDLFACRTDPNSEECRKTKQFFTELLEAIYISKYIKHRPVRFPVPLPDPSPEVGPQPEPPGLPSIVASQNILIGELLVHALSHSNQQPSSPSLIDEIRKSGVQLEVVRSLIKQFETATQALKKEVIALESCK